MNHHRLLARTILGHVLQAEALRQVEVDLYRRKLPQPSERVYHLDVNLRSVERRLARDGLVLDIPAFQHVLQRLGSVNPLLFTAHEILAVLGIPRRKLGLELVEAKILEHIQSELETVANLIF